MKPIRSRWRIWHRRLAWVVAVQLLLWSISGAFMVWLELDYIRGNSHSSSHGQSIFSTERSLSFASMDQIYAAVGPVSAITLRRLPNDRWIYAVEQPTKSLLIDATTLETITLSKSDIRAIANAFRLPENESFTIQSVTLLTEDLPPEVATAALPLWQVTYSDFLNTTLYIDALTGTLASTRHDFWRLFDVMWMLHIMDYDERQDISTWWAQLFMLLGFLFVITGSALVIVQLVRLGRRFYA